MMSRNLIFNGTALAGTIFVLVGMQASAQAQDAPQFRPVDASSGQPGQPMQPPSMPQPQFVPQGAGQYQAGAPAYPAARQGYQGAPMMPPGPMQGPPMQAGPMPGYPARPPMGPGPYGAGNYPPPPPPPREFRRKRDRDRGWKDGPSGWFSGDRKPWRGDNPWDFWDSGDPKESMSRGWDDMLNAPSRMGEMPGGWYAPTISVPNPVDVTEELGNAARDMPDQVENMRSDE